MHADQGFITKHWGRHGELPTSESTFPLLGSSGAAVTHAVWLHHFCQLFRDNATDSGFGFFSFLFLSAVQHRNGSPVLAWVLTWQLGRKWAPPNQFTEKEQLACLDVTSELLLEKVEVNTVVPWTKSILFFVILNVLILLLQFSYHLNRMHVWNMGLMHALPTIFLGQQFVHNWV